VIVTTGDADPAVKAMVVGVADTVMDSETLYVTVTLAVFEVICAGVTCGNEATPSKSATLSKNRPIIFK